MGRPDWKGLLEHVALGLDTAERNDDYGYVSDNRSYKIESNRQTREVEVTIRRGDLFPDRSPLVGYMNRQRLEQVQELIAAAAVRETWFKEHEALFFAAAGE